MSGQYPYAPPPPPPPSAAPASGYSYGQQSYSPVPRGGGSSTPGSGAGRGRAYGHGQGHGRAEYGSPSYGGYGQQDYAHAPAPYSHQPANGYWSGNPASQSGAPLPPNNYHPNYAPQTYAAQPPSTYPSSSYPTGGQRPPYQASYNSPTPEYPAQPWGDAGSPYSSYSNRGGRGGYPQGDRGGHRPDPASSAMRMGYDQSPAHSTQASAGYGQQYPPPSHHPTPAYSAPYSSYPPTTVPAYPGPAPAPAPYGHNAHNSNRGRGRDGFSGHSRGRGGHHNDRNDKFRHKGQRPPHHEHHNAQKSDAMSGKKKKRKTNTLGLTPGDGLDSDKDEADEEKRLAEFLGNDAPVVADIAAYIAERRANFPTKARIQAKKEADEAKRAAAAEVGQEQRPAPKVDKDEEKAEKLRRQLAKVERKLEKRKRETNDEGDEMRVSNADSESSSSSDDEPPETQTTRKDASSFQPPPPIVRADPKAHCKYYATGGHCGKKGKCRFVHDPEMREKALQEQAANGGRMTLRQRLVVNEKEIEDLAIIQSIVNFRESGKMPQPPKPTSTTVISSTCTSPVLTEIPIRQDCPNKRHSAGQTIVPPADADTAPDPPDLVQVKLSWFLNMYKSLPAGFTDVSLIDMQGNTDRDRDERRRRR
ncbi:hypothetical protein JX266_006577 [Neoarthrinium moseri]|nr:hypothetical protein JX266_006577 [Neoarthrinium moseri]